MNKSEKILLQLTYSHLFSHVKDHSTKGLCLSEFIDNSISSYLKMSNNESQIANIGKCEIKIIIDETDPNNYKLQIHDNAGGMNKEELEASSKEYYMNHLKKNDQLNQYGLGMKFAIFWFGKNGKIWTKRKDGHEYFLNYNSMDHKETDEVQVTLKLSNDNLINGNGTIIEIENIWNEGTINRRILKKEGDSGEKLQDILDTIKYRYREYIRNGLTIHFYRKIKDCNKEESCGSILPADIDDISVFKHNAFTLKKACKIDDTKIPSDSQKEQLENKKNELKSCKEKLINNNIYKDLFYLLENNEPLIVDEKIIFNNNELNFKLCFLNIASSKWSGIAIKHCNRFIYHLPCKTIHGARLGTLPFVYKRHKDGIDRWLYAEVDLSDTEKYGISPDKNKAKLIWGELFEEWNQEFIKLIDKYESFIRNVLQKLTIHSSPESSKRLEKAKNINPALSDMYQDECTDNIILKQDSNNEIYKQYNINGTMIICKKDYDLLELFDYHQESDNTLILRYNPDNNYLEKETLEFTILKLIGLLCLIGSGKCKDEDILKIINNIARNDFNE